MRVGVVSNDIVFTGKSGLSFPDPFRHRHERGANLSGERCARRKPAAVADAYLRVLSTSSSGTAMFANRST